MPLPALHERLEQVDDKTVIAPPICHCEEAAGRRGALSAKREEVPLGCNLGKAVTISPIAFPRRVGYCEIAPQGHFLALRAQGATSAFGLLAMTNLEVLRQ